MNFLKLTAENPDQLLQAAPNGYGAGAVIQVQSGAAEAGPFTDDGTKAIVAGVRAYDYTDADGTSSTWYRTRFENAAGTDVSDWTAARQAGDETAGLLCSLYDVRQRIGLTASQVTEDENLLEFIRQASAFIEEETGRWFAPRPTDPASTVTYRFDVERTSRKLWLVRGNRNVGIRTLTAINLATTSQPETGGTYTAGTLADILLRPKPTTDGPASRLEITDIPTGSFSYFWAGYNTVEATGSFGWESVPRDVQAAAADLVVTMHRGRADGGIGGQVTVNVDGSRSYERLPSSVWRVLNYYRSADRLIA
jgi:hypothetical protein